MLKAITASFVYELREIRHSWYKLSLLTVLPVMLAVLIISVFRDGVVRDMPLVLVDKDHSTLSRVFVNHLDASPTMAVAYKVGSVREGIALVQKSQAYGVVIVPKGFEKNTLLHLQPKITAMLNTQFILIGKIVTADLTAVALESAAEIEYLQSLQETQNPTLSLKKIAPVGMQVTPFFNLYKNYFYFLVSALIPAIWQIFIVITTLIAIGGMVKEQRVKAFFVTDKHIWGKLMGLVLPYTVIYTIWGVLFLLYIYSFWAFQGSFAIVILGSVLTVIAYQSMALFLFVIGFDYARSLSLGAVYTAPAFAFLGITFPMYNMNDFALFWRDLLPLSHYLQLQISQANYGANPWEESSRLLVLASFSLIMIPVVIRFKAYLRKELH